MRIVWFGLISVSFSIFAQKNADTGDLISKDVFNSSTLSIGSVQQSILSPTQFQTLNGNCWRLMDGSSLEGTDLKTLTSMEYLPDAMTEGVFFRQAKNGRVAGSYKSIEFNYLFL